MNAGINISIKKRIYWSFTLLVCLFVLSGVITNITLNSNTKLSARLSNSVDPSLQALNDFKNLMLESEMYATNWVFLRSKLEDKKLLQKLHDTDYKLLKARINSYTSNWVKRNWVDSINKVQAGFEELMSIEKIIMTSLNKFEDYDDPVIRLEAERIVEEEILPRTAKLKGSLEAIHAFGMTIRTGENAKLENASMKLRGFILVLAIATICAGLFLSLYMTKVIIAPITSISLIIKDLGKGIIHKINDPGGRDEMSRMVSAVNSLSDKLKATATFADEIGNRRFESHFEPLSSEDILGKALVAMRDNLKTGETNLLAVHKELNILFNSIDEIFFSVNMVTLKVIQISPTCEKLYGYTQADFLANYALWFDIIHPDDKYVINDEDEVLKRGEQINNEYRIVRKDKLIRWVETKITPTLDTDGNLTRVDGITSDITIRKQAEIEFQKSEERYRQIVETAQEGIWLIDENNYTTFVNKKICDMLEYTQEEMLGKQNYKFQNEEEGKKAALQLAGMKRGISDGLDTSYMTRSGKQVWVHVSNNPIYNDDGEYKGSMAMITNNTQRKIYEESLKLSEANLASQNKELERKNKELEQFAFVASHDLQEPLRTTSSFVELLRKQYTGKLDAKGDRYLQYIGQASERMELLIADLLEYSRIGNYGELQQVDCNIVLHEVLSELAPLIKETAADIITGSLPVISGYETEMKHLILNLVYNAIKFRKNNTAPIIEISASEMEGNWLFTFKDNGIGIAKEHNEKIFIIFQRLHTRNAYKGSGIGLSHCKKIVELHKGKIWLESVLGTGTSFYFTIPQDKIIGERILKSA